MGGGRKRGGWPAPTISSRSTRRTTGSSLAGRRPAGSSGSSEASSSRARRTSRRGPRRRAARIGSLIPIGARSARGRRGGVDERPPVRLWMPGAARSWRLEPHALRQREAPEAGLSEARREGGGGGRRPRVPIAREDPGVHGYRRAYRGRSARRRTRERTTSTASARAPQGGSGLLPRPGPGPRAPGAPGARDDGRRGGRLRSDPDRAKEPRPASR